MARERQRHPLDAARVIGIALAAVTLSWMFRDADLDRVGELLQGVGGWALLLLLPQLASLLLESVGWQLAFDAQGRRVPLLGLLRVRLATEALAQTLPMGVLICESLKPFLLGKNCGLPLHGALAGMAARKWLLVGSQALYVAIFAVLGFGSLAAISPAVVGGSALPYLTLGAALLLALLALVSFMLLSRGRVATRMFELLMRIPLRRWRARISQSRERFTDTDGELQRFFGAALRSPRPFLWFLGGWLLEAAETALILALLGVQLPLVTIGAMEVAASFLRNVAFFVPAGLGVQDAGYLAFLRALGVPDALHVTAAFLLLKRSKELCWAAIGYAILALDWKPKPLPRLGPELGEELC